LRGNKLQIQGFSSWVKHIIGRADTGQYFYRLHSSCFASGASTGIVTRKPYQTLLSGFGKLDNIRFAFQRLYLRFVSAGEYAKVAYLYKTTGQNMHSKTSEKFNSREGHKFLIGIIVVILVGECNVTPVYVFDTRIADSYPIGVFG